MSGYGVIQFKAARSASRPAAVGGRPSVISMSASLELNPHKLASYVSAPNVVSSLSAMDLNPLYSTATWCFTLVLALLLIVDSRKRCGTLACSGLELPYLPAFALAIMADWLQGPYVYALYASLGYGRTDINVLFVIGFGTSGLAGPFIGTLADRFGRKTVILALYCGTYTVACVSKHFDNYWMLALGRVSGGLATSVLFSCFESWLVAEHQRLKLPASALTQVLTYQYFINGLSGCTMGIFAQIVVDSMPLQPLNTLAQLSAPFADWPLYVGGPTLPFDLSAACLVLAATIICCTWKEQIWYNRNELTEKGTEPTGAPPAKTGILEALRVVWRNKTLLTIMMCSACTESAMYAFVIEWTPALTVGEFSPPHGLVFSSFMICYMAGSTIFGLLSPCMRAKTMLIGFTMLSVAAMSTTWALFHFGIAQTYMGSFMVFLLLWCQAPHPAPFSISTPMPAGAHWTHWPCSLLLWCGTPK